MNKKHELHPKGTKRIKSRDLNLYEKDKDDWILLNSYEPQTRKIIEIYKKEKQLELLIDNFLSDFLKGRKTPEDKPAGERINILPNGKKLARGGFSLFAKNIELNLYPTPSWAVKYENTSGTTTYLYDEDNIHLEHEKKNKLVNKFIKLLPEILEKLIKDIETKKDIKYIMLLILIKTKMRVGDTHHFHHLGHKGLTTLQKGDIKINNNKLYFNYTGKDGVPQEHNVELETNILKKIYNHIKTKESYEFAFTNIKNHPFHSHNFSDILFEYTNEHFYPHIIRSAYADSEIKKFIRNHKTATKEQIKNKYIEIGKELGHKKFNKKKKEWETDYKVTIKNYIREEYVEKMNELGNKI